MSFPAELKKLRRWVGFRLEPDEKNNQSYDFIDYIKTP